eukprot:TRINITY_DN2032_c1_g1_i1.p1 TRINITY_DN2032_c1_g1~~TRINITY_DN2032_c1_g1_i1.p1  ORF type:complete len:1096 (+),score=387.26 TRINITY_DN2032_c1_g1_i1:119-3406(+)
MEDRGFRAGPVRGRKGVRSGWVRKHSLPRSGGRTPVPPANDAPVSRPVSAMSHGSFGSFHVSGVGYDPPSTLGVGLDIPTPSPALSNAPLSSLSQGTGGSVGASPAPSPSPLMRPSPPEVRAREGYARASSPQGEGRADDMSAVQMLICDRMTDGDFMRFVAAADKGTRNAAMRELLYQFRRAKGFVTVSQQLALPELYSILVTTTTQQLGCGNAVVHVFDGTHGVLYHPLSPEVRVSSKAGVAGRLFRERRKLQVAFRPDEDMLPEDAALFGASCKDALCVPLLSNMPLNPPAKPASPDGGRTYLIGMISAMNKLSGPRFTPQDHVMFEALAQQCVAGLSAALAQAQLAATAAQLHHFIDVSSSYREGLAVRDIEGTAKKVMGAERSRLYLVDPQKKHSLTCVLADGHCLTIPLSGGVAGTVYETLAPLNIPAAYHDERFNTEVDRLTGFVTTSVLAVPVVKADGGAPLGVFEVLNKTGGGAFTALDEKVAAAFAAQMAYIMATNEKQTLLAKELKDVTADLARQETLCLTFDKQLMCKGVFGDVSLLGLPEEVLQTKPLPLWYLSSDPMLASGGDDEYRVVRRQSHAAGSTANSELVALVKEVLRTGTDVKILTYELLRPRQPRVRVTFTIQKPPGAADDAALKLYIRPVDEAAEWLVDLARRASSDTVLAVANRMAVTGTRRPERLRATVIAFSLRHTGGVGSVVYQKMVAPLFATHVEETRKGGEDGAASEGESDGTASEGAESSPAGEKEDGLEHQEKGSPPGSPRSGAERVRTPEARDAPLLTEASFQGDAYENMETHIDGITKYVKANGGVVLSWDADCITAIFGPPHEAADDAATAVRVGLAAKARFPDIHVGVHSGEVAVRVACGVYTCVGAAVDVAVQMANVACYYHAGVLITERTLLQAQGVFYTRTLEELYFNSEAVGVLQSYEVLATTKDKTARMERARTQLQAGLEAYRTRDWPRACQYLRELFDACADATAAMCLRRALLIRENHHYIPSLKWSGAMNAYSFQPHVTILPEKKDRRFIHRSSFRPDPGAATALLPSAAHGGALPTPGKKAARVKSPPAAAASKDPPQADKKARQSKTRNA